MTGNNYRVSISCMKDFLFVSKYLFFCYFVMKITPVVTAKIDFSLKISQWYLKIFISLNEETVFDFVLRMCKRISYFPNQELFEDCALRQAEIDCINYFFGGIFDRCWNRFSFKFLPFRYSYHINSKVIESIEFNQVAVQKQ